MASRIPVLTLHMRPMFGPLTRSGFSLVELLAVLTIGIILASLSITALNGLSSSGNLNSGVNNLGEQLELARRTALTMDRAVQMRFYVNNATPAAIRSLQLVIPSDVSPATPSDPDQPLGKVTFFPTGVIIADQSSLSTIYTGSLTTPTSPYPALPANVTSYYCLTFNTNGSVTPAPSGGVTTWTIDLVPEGPYRAKGGALPPDYATFTIDSVKGTYTVTRP